MSNLEFILAIIVLFIACAFCVIGLYLVVSGKLKRWYHNKLYDFFHFISGKVNKNNPAKPNANKENNFNFCHDEPSTNYAPTYTHQSTQKSTYTSSPITPQPTRTFTSPAYSLDNYELKYDYNNVFLALSNNYDCSGVTVNDPCILAGEPSNSYDPKAVAVYCRGKKIGYLKKGRLQDMYHDFIDRDEKVTATISKIENGNVFIRLCFYKDVIQELEKNHETECYKLTGNRNSEMQDAIFLSTEGDELYYNWNYEKEKYETDIGYFPESANQYLDNDAPAYIYEIGEDDNGKRTVTVIVQID